MAEAQPQRIRIPLRRWPCTLRFSTVWHERVFQDPAGTGTGQRSAKLGRAGVGERREHAEDGVDADHRTRVSRAGTFRYGDERPAHHV